MKVTIDFIADAETPDGTSGTFYPEETRIYVRSFQMDGFALKGALNLNNSEMTEAGKPLWKDFDGAADLAFDEVIFQDGRKDGKEGQTNGTQPNETPQGLNPDIIENFCQTENGQFATGKTPGVTADTKPLFGGDVTENGGYFYIIPRNEGTTPVNIQIVYDVETIDRKLVGKLSDGETHGISIENVISKDDIFNGIDFNAGCQYEIKIHLGMTSMKVDAKVLSWTDNGSTNVNLPDNQGGNNGSGSNNMTANQMINSAFSYQYTPAYSYQGTYTVTDNQVSYTLTPFTNQAGFLVSANNMMNDFARFLGGLYRGAGVTNIRYNGTDYTWDPTAAAAHATGDELKGSNWVNAEGNTLVSVITNEITSEYQQTPFTTKTLTITADDKDINLVINVP